MTLAAHRFEEYTRTDHPTVVLVAADLNEGLRFARELVAQWSAQGRLVGLSPEGGSVLEKQMATAAYDFLIAASATSPKNDETPWVVVPPTGDGGNWSPQTLQHACLVLEDQLRQQALARPLYGLVLAGGRSSRMGRDKALMSFDAGSSQLERTVGLLQPHCQRVFCSAREDQADTYEQLGGVPVIVDSVLGAGPLGGILSAMRAHPRAAWFVTAIDLPLLCDASISHLIGQRDPFRFASVYRSIHGGFLEPLCAIYEPKFLAAAMFALGQGVTCPGRVLKDMRVLEVEQRVGDHLANINTPKDCERYFPNLVAGEIFKESVI